MIQPDRLKELIEQGATIYGITGLPRWVEEIDLGSLLYEKIGDWLYKVNTICYGSGENDFRKEKLYRFDNEDLFETREEAEWVFEFGNITREEKLSLPSWEEFCKLDYEFVFYDRNHNKFSMYLTMPVTVEKEICIWNWNIETAKVEFRKPATKENYIDACRLCKKLFLGEKV